MQISDCIGIEVIIEDRCVAYVEYQGTTASAEFTQQCSNLGGSLWVTSEVMEYTGGITHSSGTWASHTGDCYSFVRPSISRPSLDGDWQQWLGIHSTKEDCATAIVAQCSNKNAFL